MIRVALLGCGRIAYKHIEAMAANKESMVLSAVCDLVVERGQEKAKQYKKAANITVPVYFDYKEMLKNEKVDMVAIATESGYHAEQALYCMEAGKHVLVEKPMALSTKDADAMIRVAGEKNVKLGICHQNRFNPPIQKLRSTLDEQRFGKLINGTARILWNRDDGYYLQAPWRGTWDLDGGTLMNQCIHNVDLLQWMLGGEVESVYAQTGTFLRNIEAEDFGAIVLRFKNGAIGIVEGSACVYPKNLEETLSIFGETGTAVIGGLAVNRIETWKIGDCSDEEQVLRMEVENLDNVYGYGHTPLYANFARAIRNEEAVMISGEEGKKPMEIILAAYRSAKDNSVIKFPLKEVISTKDF